MLFSFLLVQCDLNKILSQVLLTGRSSCSILHTANIPGNHFMSDVRNTHIQERLQEHMSWNLLLFTETPPPHAVTPNFTWKATQTA